MQSPYEVGERGHSRCNGRTWFAKLRSCCAKLAASNKELLWGDVVIITAAAMCLALNIYHESRGESLTGQHAVAQVTWNRANHDKKNICDVVVSPNQFSWTKGVFKSWGGKFVLSNSARPKESKSWEMAQHIATITLMNVVPDFTHGATFYHTKSVNPTWNRKLVLVSVYGAHKFYKQA